MNKNKKLTVLETYVTKLNPAPEYSRPSNRYIRKDKDDMKTIKYYEKNDMVPIPIIKEIKEKTYEDIGLYEYNIYFAEMFAAKDVVIIGVSYIYYYDNNDKKEKFNFITPVELKDDVYYPVPMILQKIIRDRIEKDE